MAALTNWPLTSYQGRPPVISSGFGPRGSGDKRKMHSGADIDFRAIAGDPPYTGKYTADRTPNFYGPAGVPVIAAAAGVVKKSETQPNARGVVEVEHAGSSTRPTYRTIYRHLSSRYVKVGDRVVSGTRLGIMGASKRTPFRHLHFAVKQNGKFVDPKPMLNRAGVGVLTPAETLAPARKKKPSLPTVSVKPRPGRPTATIEPLSKRYVIAWLTFLVAVLALAKSK